MVLIRWWCTVYKMMTMVNDDNDDNDDDDDDDDNNRPTCNITLFCQIVI